MARRSNSKYFEKQSKGSHRPCDHPNCLNEGEYRAPKDKSLKEYFWFCWEHVREYNENWNYYADMKPEEIEEQIRRDTVWDRPSWNFAPRKGVKPENVRIRDAFGLFEEDGEDAPKFRSTPYSMSASPEIDSALRILDLSPPLTIEALKKRYKQLVKLYHPDITGGDKDAEERFKAVVEAYRILQKYLKGE